MPMEYIHSFVVFNRYVCYNMRSVLKRLPLLLFEKLSFIQRKYIKSQRTISSKNDMVR